MPSAYNQLIVHDTQYEVGRSYKAGALAFRAGTPNSCNPHRFGSGAHDAWDYGHVNESAGEHFRFGKDVLAEPSRGSHIPMDPDVPRRDGADPDDEWVHAQRQRLLTTAH